MTEPAPDEALAERFLARRTEADFRRLYRRLDPALRLVARKLLGDQASASADDAVQEAWLRAMRTVSRYERRSSFRTWLTGFVVNVCRETLRTARSGADVVPEPGIGGASPEAGLTLHRAVDALPQRARIVLVLHDVAGFTHAEIGDLLGIDPGTSKSQLSRARRRVRAEVEPMGDGS